jgi:ribulose-bisphosphate carboxylase large chain
MTDRFTVDYRIFAQTLPEAEARARDIALEQTVEVPDDVVPEGFIRDVIVGRVETIAHSGDGVFEARLSYSPATVGRELAQLINVIFGNSSIQRGIKVTEIALSDAMADLFPGARFGIKGLRQRSGNAAGGFVCPVIKPMGLDTQRLAEICYKTARAGADIIKEDHGLANQDTAPFRERVRACATAVARANAERGAAGDAARALYFPNIAAHAGHVRDMAFFAKEAGADGVLLIPGLYGFDAMNRLAQDPDFDLPIMAHPAHLGPYVLSPDTGYAHGALFGTLMRIAGADISVFPNHGGRFGFSVAECQDIVTACRATTGHGKPIFPSPGGGMSLERLPDMKALYGRDCVSLLGGSLLRFGDRIGDAISQMRSALS